MNGQQLKNSILQLAIQGRLVPQDSKDEPASALLARIREEKQRLVKDKKIKKEKPLAPITDDEKPFDIPESWEWVRIIDIANSQLGKTLDRGKDSGEEYPYLCSINIYWDGIDLNNVKYFKLQENEKEKYRVEKMIFLYAKEVKLQDVVFGILKWKYIIRMLYIEYDSIKRLIHTSINMLYRFIKH